MGSKKPYIKPEIILVKLDESITLMMVSNPDPRGPDGTKGAPGRSDRPFKSPFGDKPFT